MKKAKKEWVWVKSVPFAEVIARARDKYLARNRYSCYAVEDAIADEIFMTSGYEYSDFAHKYFKLDTFNFQIERQIYLDFVELYCKEYNVQMMIEAQINPKYDAEFRYKLVFNS